MAGKWTEHVFFRRLPQPILGYSALVGGGGQLMNHLTYIFIFGVEGFGVPIFVNTSVSGIYKPEWFNTLLRQVKIGPLSV